MNASLTVLILTSLVAGASLYTVPLVQPGESLIKCLQTNRLWKIGDPLRLHLGCGQHRLAGYINIDYPRADHTVQTESVADIFANITTLSMLDGQLDEIRSHHFFEHFDRQTALALLCKWISWLKVGGELVITAFCRV